MTLEENGNIIAQNFEKFGIPVNYVRGVENTLGCVFYFNLLDITQFNEKKISDIVDKISIISHTQMNFSRSDEAHFKIDVFYKKNITLPLDTIIESNAIVIGKDLDDKKLRINFYETPHLLIAGTTGSGKSVLLKTLFCSIYNFYHAPNNPRLKNAQYIIIDPKGNEFNCFRGVVDNYIDETNKAIRSLEQLEEIMDNRYRHLEMIKTPIFIFIDELADLMLTSRFEVEKSLIRIAQKGRACDMHLIIATQRPSCDIVTGLIKANFPARLCLKTAGVRDSVVVMDRKCCEELNIGEAYYKNGLTLKRIKVAYPSEDLIRRIVR